MRTAVIVAASPEVDLELLRREASRSHLMICADGGYNHCVAAGLFPHIVVGDLDSINGRPRGPIEVLAHRRDKDESDLELALLEAHRCGAQTVRILAGLGGRLDHTLFNVISILVRAHELAMQAALVGPDTEARLLVGGARVSIESRAGWTCSLIALSERVDGITLSGFLYPLHDEPLHQRETRGLSNVIVERSAEILVTEGRLLCLCLAPDAVTANC